MSDDPHLTQDTTRRLVIGIIALVQGIFLFLFVQITTRVFSMRDMIYTLQTEVARVQTRQESDMHLVESNFKYLQQQVDRLDTGPRAPRLTEKD